MIAQIGLILVAVAWLIQLVFAFRGNKDIRPEFIISYLVGVGLLVISYIQSNTWNAMSYLELGTFVAALLVLIKRLSK